MVIVPPARCFEIESSGFIMTMTLKGTLFEIEIVSSEEHFEIQIWFSLSSWIWCQFL